MKVPLIVPYDPRWPAVFETLRERTAEVLGPLAARIEHVGSTSVPGLPAKPIIDMDVLLAAPDGLHVAVKRLAVLGYPHQGELGIAGRHAFGTPSADPPHHLYVCLPGCLEFRRHLALRDYLRNHDEEARAYGDFKLALAHRCANERATYTAGKQAYVEALVRRAMDHQPRQRDTPS